MLIKSNLLWTPANATMKFRDDLAFELGVKFQRTSSLLELNSNFYNKFQFWTSIKRFTFPDTKQSALTHPIFLRKHNY
jgi:hypothetical protein